MKKHGTNIGFGMNASKYLCENLCLFNNVCVKMALLLTKYLFIWKNQNIC